MKVPFAKMHGLGNDFILVDCREQRLDNPAAFARTWCKRRWGVGADQVLLVLPSTAADLRMDIYNADGGEVEMCGNGVRAFALYARLLGAWDGSGTLTVETKGGVVRPRLVDGSRVEVDMGAPRFGPAEIPVRLDGDQVIDRTLPLAGGKRNITCVNMGNPHCVLFTDDLSAIALDMLGPQIETDDLFPQRTNVEFVQVRAPDQLAVRVWERGAGATLACGSGACAALVAAVRLGRTLRKATVQLPGGTLEIEWREADGHVYKTGPATFVYQGELAWPL